VIAALITGAVVAAVIGLTVRADRRSNTERADRES